MTEKEFLKELSKLKRFGWDEINEAIRCGDDMCPIVAIATAKTGKRYKTDRWGKAASAIKLKDDLAKDIVEGSDYLGYRLSHRIRKALGISC